jgi:GH15 family glucan-1,4-alpha-glucosidase
MLSDCHAPALVSPRGSIDWWCPPRGDGPSVFARLLGPDAGHWAVHAQDATVSVTRRYLPDSLVLETTITTPDGEVVVIDALGLDPDARGHDIGRTSPQLLVRSVEGRRGRVRMHTTFRPRIEYGLTTPVLEPTAHGVTSRGGALVLRLESPVPLDCDGGQATATWDVAAGARTPFALALTPAYGAGADGDTAPDPDDALAGTLAGWRSWVAVHEPFDGAYGDMLRRSALVLQGLTYQPSGAVLAAATTSLRAAIGGTDNWDYRNTWLRDLSLTAQALWIAACPDEAGRYLRFIIDSTGAPAEGGCRSCTASTVAGACRSQSCPTCTATRAAPP